MRVTIGLGRDIIIIPDNFFKKVAKENTTSEVWCRAGKGA